MKDLAQIKHQNPVEFEPDHILSQGFTKPQTVTTTLDEIVFHTSKFGYCELELKKTRSFC